MSEVSSSKLKGGVVLSNGSAAPSRKMSIRLRGRVIPRSRRSSSAIRITRVRLVEDASLDVVLTHFPRADEIQQRVGRRHDDGDDTYGDQ